jgi:UDP-GlcNAc:undecaprenyl-phosphate/decaprenyl-phosphate GlcNAc-1-phosphate transferase
LAIAERLVLSLLLASSIVYAATPVAIALADRLKFYDQPLGYKAHVHPTPYLGGTAVMVGFAVAILLAAGQSAKTAPVVGGAALLWFVGTVDDRRNVSPWLRVAVELALAWVVWRCGLGWSLHMGGGVDLVVTAVWLVGVINAFNLFDKMDGAASTMALVVCAGAAVLGVVGKDVWLAVGAASLGGACLGFLPRNLSLPARIFLGDGGSMPVGFVVAVLVTGAATNAAPGWQSLPVALLLVGLPVLDTTLVIVSRRRRGVPVLAGGKDHLTHRTHRFLPGTRAVALGLGGVQAMVSVVAVLATQGGSSFVVVAAAAYAIAALCAIAALETGSPVDPSPEPGDLAGIDASSGLHEGELPSYPARDLSAPSVALIVLLGLGAGLSPFWFAYYGVGVWVPIGLGIVLLCAICLLGRPMRPSPPAMMAIAGLLGVGVWSLCSTSWTESVEGAIVGGDRWLAYGALLLLMVVLVRSERRAALLLLAAATGVVIVALSVLVRLLGDDPGALFLGGRLNSPLGYINGEGCLFAMGFWLCMAAAETRRGLVAGPAAGMAALMASLTLLTQSRGTALAMGVALVVVVALVPGRTRRVYGLIVVGVGVALAAPSALRVYSSTHGGSVSVDVGHAAGRALLLTSLGVAAVWALLTETWRVASARGAVPGSARTVGSALLVALTLVAVALALGSAHAIDREANAQWSAFTHLTGSEATVSASDSPSTTHTQTGGSASSSSAGRSRLLSGAGNRYDYWRIAWRLWTEHPVIGVGGDGYSRYYYERRATTEDVDQPHSVELQLLSDLGAIGALLLACFVGGAAWGATRMARMAPHRSLTRIAVVGATGAFCVWMTQTSVDWMHRLPGLTAIALAAVTVLIWPRSAAPRAGVGAQRARVTRVLAGRRTLALAASAAMATLVVAGGSLTRQELSQIYAKRALKEIAAKPGAAVEDADRSLGIDSDGIATYYLKAAALARFGRATEAEATLRQALARQPNDFVTWALLGDIAVREHRFVVAGRDYRRASELNPLNFTLLALKANPESALH